MHKYVMNGQILVSMLVTSPAASSQTVVQYPAISDTPAWIVVKANDFARSNSLSPFVLYQGKWNVGFRDMERDIIRKLS
jgi:aryl-alcohol dehydrogenase-like predicted oxidoreductase